MNKYYFIDSFFIHMPIMFEVRPLYFVIRLYARNDIFKNVRKKHGQDIVTVIRSLNKRR